MSEFDNILKRVSEDFESGKLTKSAFIAAFREAVVALGEGPASSLIDALCKYASNDSWVEAAERSLERNPP